MEWLKWIASGWHYAVAALTIFISIVASAHAVLYKRDPRAATLWASFIWFVPLIGAVLYFSLGVNRIRRRAVILRAGKDSFHLPRTEYECSTGSLRDALAVPCSYLSSLADINNSIVHRKLLVGNKIEMLQDGDEAYPAMLKAIDEAKTSISLSTYIFDRDEAGIEFTRALGRAVRRGVEVRVLIDATGTRYSFPTVLDLLRREKVAFARFLPTFPLWQIVSVNLRNHRKVLVVDGKTAFTGGLNIRIGHWLNKSPKHPVRDLHFRIQGPVVGHAQEIFAEDWFFTTREVLKGDKWFQPLKPEGEVIARGIADGPDEDFEKVRWIILGALTTARKSVRIATPYFLPDPSIITALNLAARRGVQVDILLPQKNNLPFVHWASVAHWWQVLEHGCRIWLSPPPFDHSKVFVVDECWTLIGSANWDPRSLRLNFEFNLECYDAPFAACLTHWFDRHLLNSKRITLQEVDSRRLPIRLRDGLARLLTPFL